MRTVPRREVARRERPINKFIALALLAVGPELDGRTAGDAIVIDVPSNTTVEREVRFRWLP